MYLFLVSSPDYHNLQAKGNLVDLVYFTRMCIGQSDCYVINNSIFVVTTWQQIANSLRYFLSTSTAV